MWNSYWSLSFPNDMLPLLRSFCNTNVRAQEASAPNIGTEQSQCHLTWLPGICKVCVKKCNWKSMLVKIPDGSQQDEEYKLSVVRSAFTCIPSTPLIPIPMSASWSIPTSFAPSPIARVVVPVLTLTSLVTWIIK